MFERNWLTLFKKNQYKYITAKQIARDNDLEYIDDAETEKANIGNEFSNNFYAFEGKYILLYPANDGMSTCPFKWWKVIDGVPKMVIENKDSFKSIVNLNEIIMQMIELYTKYIDDNVFIASYSFAVKLEDEVQPNYTGRASLVLTKDSVRNNRVKRNELNNAKKYFLNDFLDHYIGWNFGRTIKSNPELEQALIDFNNLVIKKGLREYAGTGFEVWQSEDVMHYEFETV